MARLVRRRYRGIVPGRYKPACPLSRLRKGSRQAVVDDLSRRIRRLLVLPEELKLRVVFGIEVPDFAEGLPRAACRRSFGIP
jgi:hypothetical protein